MNQKPKAEKQFFCSLLFCSLLFVICDIYSYLEYFPLMNHSPLTTHYSPVYRESVERADALLVQRIER